MKNLSSLFLLIALVSSYSCQSFKSQKDESKKNVTRTLASTPAFRIFIQELAQKSQRYTAASIEEAALTYIKRVESGSKHGNWTKLGLSEQEAKAIRSLDDEFIFMPKVRKWITENATKFLRVETSVAELAYDSMKNGIRVLENPYRASQSLSGQIIGARNRFNPSRGAPATLLSKEERLVKTLADVPPSLQARYKNNLDIFMERAKNNPSIKYNGEEIIESSINITRKTGQPGMGAGCREFSKAAPEEILAQKANVDIFTSQQIEELAYLKNGSPFNKFTDIPPQKRLTAKDIDESRVEAFKRVKNLTDEEARVALERLKRAPCQIY